MIYTLSSDTLTMFVKNRPYVIHNSHPSWPKMMDIIKGVVDQPSDDELIELLSVREAMKKAISDERVTVGYDGIYFQGNLLTGYMAERIFQMSRQGLQIDPWIKFLDKMMDHHSKQIFDDLFAWMEASRMPVTPDGNFIAYKKVNTDYRSFHASPDGSHLLHTKGEVVEMPRREVDDRRERTCSTGLHFASYDYAANSYYGGRGRMIVLEIDPRDVVSIPTDYNQQKGRAARYKMIDELEDMHVDPLTDTLVYDNDDDDEDTFGWYEEGGLNEMLSVDAGDIVKCVDHEGEDLTVGRDYKVCYDVDYDHLYVVGDNGHRTIRGLFHVRLND